MKTISALLLALVATSCAFAQSATKMDTEKLVGDWEYVAGTRAGEDVAKERLVGTVTITEKTLKIPGGPEGDL